MAQSWADTLQGAGAWLSGQGPQYMLARESQQRTQLADERAQRQYEADMRRERMMATVQDTARLANLYAMGDLDGVTGLLQQRLSALQESGGDPSHTQALLQAHQQDPRAAARDVMAGYQTFQSMGLLRPMGGEASNNASAKTTHYDNGTTMLTLPDGSTRVFDPSGREVSGGDRTAVLKAARNEQISHYGDRTRAMTEGELDARFRLEPKVKTAVEEAMQGVRLTAEKEKRGATNQTALQVYDAGMGGLVEALGGTTTGPGVGWLPALTSSQQIADGAVSAMAPILKQMFRAAGEGVFTDRDQALLLGMVPDRRDTPEARAWKVQNIDNIVRAKLGMTKDEFPERSAPVDQEQPQSAPLQNAQGWQLMTDANGNQAYVGPNGEVEEVQ